MKRLGYKSFIGLIWALWKINRNNKRLNVETRVEIVLPVK